jgi:hypothetical protein
MPVVLISEQNWGAPAVHADFYESALAGIEIALHN